MRSKESTSKQQNTELISNESEKMHNRINPTLQNLVEEDFLDNSVKKHNTPSNTHKIFTESFETVHIMVDSKERRLIELLRVELKKAYLLIDLAKTREERFKVKIKDMKEEVRAVRQILESSVVLPLGSVQQQNSLELVESSQIRIDKQHLELKRKLAEVELALKEAKNNAKILKEERDCLDNKNQELRSTLHEAEEQCFNLVRIKDLLRSNPSDVFHPV